MIYYNKRHLVVIVSVDWFFVSHRLELFKLLANDYKITVITKLTDHEEAIKRSGINVVDFDFKRKFSGMFSEIEVILNLKRILKSVKPDILYIFSLRLITQYILLNFINGDKYKSVYGFTGLGYIFTHRSIKNNILKYFLKSLITFDINYNTNKKILLFQNLRDLNEISLINNSRIIHGSGIDMNFYHSKYLSKSDVLRFIFVGRLLRDKGILEFIAAAKLIKEPCEFYICGIIDESNPNSISESCLLYLIHNFKNIFWHKNVKDVRTLYNTKTVAVLPSYREGIPKSLIEACALGVPIVTTNNTGCEECVDIHHPNGFLVPPRSIEDLRKAMIKFINMSDGEFVVKANNSRHLAERKFSMDIIFQKVRVINLELTQ